MHEPCRKSEEGQDKGQTVPEERLADDMEIEPWETVMDRPLFKQFIGGLCRRPNEILQCWYSDMSNEDKIKVLRRYARTPPEHRQGHKSAFWKNWYREFLGLRDRSRSPRTQE